MATWPETLEALVRERGRALFGYAYLLAGDADVAEDLLQEALVRSFRRDRVPAGLAAAHAYVKRAIQTAFIDTHRREASRPRRDDRQADLLEPDPAQGSALRGAVRDAVRALPPRERTCLVMRYYDGLSAAAIAHELGLAPGTVRKYLSHAVETLQRTSGGFGLEPADATDGGSDADVIVIEGGSR
ncbi:sigma-70 family RNA polymerase sigma factor [Demequina iriomotensis]|uniref:sigma-70 family RNA polymerase sigma factor n=1 Tax=Demequina iriomotensis TaxID=1536641 RepID=UPI000780D228|nr:sigma-70 family RNA polymerase sigma factor [Demequina iriomotensis]